MEKVEKEDERENDLPARRHRSLHMHAAARADDATEVMSAGPSAAGRKTPRKGAERAAGGGNARRAAFFDGAFVLVHATFCVFFPFFLFRFLPYGNRARFYGVRRRGMLGEGR